MEDEGKMLEEIQLKDPETDDVVQGTLPVDGQTASDEPRPSRLSPAVLCPKYHVTLRLLTLLAILAVLWGSSYAIFGKALLPKAEVFALASLIVLAYIAGWLVSLIRLPPLLGMLLTGILLKNVGFFNMTGYYIKAVSALRMAAMVVILIKAGLGLDAAALKKFVVVVVLFGFLPCLVEAATVTVVAHLIMGFRWLWGAVLGFVLSSVSPAVVVPSLLNLKEQGYGEDKGISTLVIAACCIDNIVAIVGFGIALGLTFHTGKLIEQIFHGPIEVVLGTASGLFWGSLLIYLPHKDDKLVVGGRAVLVGLGALFAVFGSSKLGYSGAGPLANMLAAFVASYGWKKLGWSSSFNPVSDIYGIIWKIFEPVLFGLIGTEVNLLTLDRNTVLYGLCVLAIGLVFQFLVIGACTFASSSFNKKERIFLCIAYFPKATIQAALGPLALDMAREKQAGAHVEELAAHILSIAVLSIILTAPIGAVVIFMAGPKLLGRVEPSP